MQKSRSNQSEQKKEDERKKIAAYRSSKRHSQTESAKEDERKKNAASRRRKRHNQTDSEKAAAKKKIGQGKPNRKQMLKTKKHLLRMMKRMNY